MKTCWLASLVVGVMVLCGAAPPPAVSTGGMVAADHRLGSDAGAEILSKGGNAVDAAVATALAVGVVQPAGSGLGGGGFAVVVAADGESHVLDFREEAPKAATRDMYVHTDIPDASRVGGLAVGVPGEAAGLAELHARWGSLPLTDVAAPAIRLAREGFQVESHLASALKRSGVAGPSLSMGLFNEPEVPTIGTHVKRVRLASTIEAFAETGGKALHVGPIAADIVAATVAAGGILSEDDLANYRTRDRPPVIGQYKGWTVITMPPPSSGGVVLMQILGVLEAVDIAGSGPHSAETFHRLAEAMKHAFADRARYMGDPDRIQVPIDQLLAPSRIAAIQQDFDPKKTHERDHYGTSIDIGTDGGTQHISVLDKDGMAVALTTTINTSFASRVVAPESGILLNNEMDDFVAKPGVPNHYGLVGSESNAVAAGARPLSSMSPTVLISPDKTERIVVGASGGPFIITSTLQAILNVVDFGMDPAEAVSVPRIHHQWAPEILFVDEGVSRDTITALEALGHTVKQIDFFSSVQLIHGTEHHLQAASDPRKGGWPAGSQK
ncbi:MAG: gamma-glutamyltransferase [Myxococcota bacterium]